MIEPLTLNPEKLEKEIDFSDLEKHRIRPSDIIPPPEIAIKMFIDENPDSYAIMGTLGNFSTYIGKAKAKKTFFVSIAVASAISDKAVFRTYLGCLPPHQCNVLYFDTEQSKWHVQKVVKRICYLCDIADPENLMVYGLRSEDTKTRLAFIEKKIYETENLGFVVIDGVRDLVYDINDPAEASEIAGKLLKWSEELNIHIVTVLHQNKGDGNARGHLGTELMNKAETVLAVEKKENSDVSVVVPQFCRNREPDLFAFEVDDNGIPFKVRVPQSEDKTGASFDVAEIDPNLIFDLLKTVFEKVNMQPLRYSDLQNQIKVLSKSFFSLKNSLGDNRVKSLITIARNENILEQNPEHEKGKSKPYTLNLKWGLLSV